MIIDTDNNLLFAADPLYGGTMALSYNSRNQLLSAAVGGVSGSFTYDAEGHRQSATHAGQTSTFTVNPAAELSQVLVCQVEGGQRTWAVYGQGLLYEVEIESVGEPVYTLVGGDMMMLVSQVTERLRVHHYDQTGNTVAITDGQGCDVLWVQYDAYGAVVHAESPTQADGGAPVRPEVNALPDGLQRALAVTPWLYVGEHGVMTDPTGLLHMRARYYHPGLRRFLNADPIQFEGGMNWYGYAIGDPVMNSDPSWLVAYAFPPQYAQSAEFRDGFNRGAAAAVPAGLGVGVAMITGPIVGGAALSAGINASNQILNVQQGKQQSFSGTQMAVHGTIGAVVPAGLNRAVPAAMRKLPPRVKGTLGETFSWINGGLSGRGWSPIPQQTLRIAGRRPRPDFTYPGMGTNGATLYVEAKFGTSTLTSAQRIASNRLGDNWITESWTYGWIGSTAAGAGNAVMGLGNVLFGGSRGGLSSGGGGCYGRR
jgi:RHS repeat-associated protein